MIHGKNKEIKKANARSQENWRGSVWTLPSRNPDPAQLNYVSSVSHALKSLSPEPLFLLTMEYALLTLQTDSICQSLSSPVSLQGNPPYYSEPTHPHHPPFIH